MLSLVSRSLRLAALSSLCLTVAAPVAHADVAPPKGLKRVQRQVVFVGLSAHKGYTFVLVERSGPKPGQCVAVSEGKVYDKLSYRWWSPALYAVRGAGVKADAALCKKLMADKSAVKFEAVTPGPSTISDKHNATTVRVTYKVSGVTATAINAAFHKRLFVDANGKSVGPGPVARKKASSCSVGDGRPGAGAVIGLLLLGCALLSRRRR